MEIAIRKGDITEEPADLLVVSLFSGVTEPEGAVGALDDALGGMIRDVLATGDLTGETGEVLLLYTRAAIPSPRVLVVGMGEAKKVDLQGIRSAAATAARKARDLGVSHFATIVHGSGASGVGVEAAAVALTEGTRLGLWRYAGLRSKLPNDWKTDPQKMTIVALSGEDLAAVRAGVARGEIIAEGVNLVRDMVTSPANQMTPADMADIARVLASKTGLCFKALGRAECKALSMGIFMAVAEESEQDPKLIVLEHNAGRRDLPTVVLIGKGVTFDSGGISLKIRDDLWTLKKDMAGAAAVIATLGIAVRLAIPLHVVGLAPCVENLPGGRAQKPGDVFTGITGKTVEVISTDAEGRMLLADALAYASRFDPAAVIDIATLTGVQSLALGPQAACFFANDESLAARLQASADVSGERVWRFPLFEEYWESIKSEVADVKNSATRFAGLGTSAKFLEYFTDGYPWAHIDMASMSLSDDDRPTQPRGATGYGVRLLTALLEGW